MAILTELLVASKHLQEYLVDKSTGLPLSAGIVSCYQDNSRTLFKNWYYQSGVPGAYTYLALPNPLTLSSVGTVQNPAGEDVIPFYYPYLESDNATPQKYYITVESSDLQLQFSRENWPPVSGDEDLSDRPTFQNLILNNRFWRNIGSKDLQTEEDIVLCPSQHDGFRMPDIRYIKDNTTAVESMEFSQFSLGERRWDGDVRGEFYIHHQCTGPGTGETSKYYQFPISLHLRTLQNVRATATIEAKNVSGNSNNILSLKILKDLGTDAATIIGFNVKTFALTDDWQKYSFSFTFPSPVEEDLSKGGDDAYYLQVHLQTDADLDLEFALPSIYLSDDIPTNDFQTYDQIDPIINGFRTGDFRHSMNAFQPFGWVPANDGSIGYVGSAASIRKNSDTWPLYKLLWENVIDTWAPVSSGRGSSAFSDFEALKILSLTKNLGRILAGLNPVFITPSIFTATITPVDYTFSGVSLTLVDPITFVAGDPIQVNSTLTLPDPLVTATTYYVSSNNLSTTNIEITLTQAQAIAGVATDSITLTGGTGTQNIVNTDNRLTLTTVTTLIAGTPIQLTNSGGGLPSGLLPNIVYYVSTSQLSTTIIKLALNLEDALAGFFEPILTAGTGIQTVQTALGATSGASFSTEPPRHSHTYTEAVTPTNKSSGGGPTLESTASANTGFTGVEKMGLLQPTSFVNVFLKL